jgi:hypothetical protein
MTKSVSEFAVYLAWPVRAELENFLSIISPITIKGAEATFFESLKNTNISSIKSLHILSSIDNELSNFYKKVNLYCKKKSMVCFSFFSCMFKFCNYLFTI